MGGLLAPGGIGGAGVNARYLERSGIGRAESVAAVTLASTAGFAVYVAALVTLGGILTGTGVPPIPVPSRWILLAVVIGIAALAGAVAGSPQPPAPAGSGPRDGAQPLGRPPPPAAGRPAARW